MPPTAVGQRYPTILDVTQRMTEEGAIIELITGLSQSNTVLQVCPFIETNMVDGHRWNVETYAPLPSFRAKNQGVIPSFGKIQEQVEETAELKDFLEIDKKVADKGGKPNQVRYDLSMSKMRAMGRKYANEFFYGNVGQDPLGFNGLFIRTNALSGQPNSKNIVDGGGRANTNTSVYLIGFGPRAVTGLYPMGSTAGFKHTDLKVQYVTNAVDVNGGATGRMTVYADEFEWDGGLAVLDWRHLAAGHNIDVPSLNALTNDADCAYIMDELYARMPEETNTPPEPGVTLTRPTYYYFFNRTFRRGLGHQLQKTAIQGSALAATGPEGTRRELPRIIFEYEYNGISCGINDAILNNEANVS